MQPDSRDAARLWDMRVYAEHALTLIGDASFERFQSDPGMRLGVERALEIVDEAARVISATFKDAHPEIDWSGIVGLRTILAHQYSEVDIDTLWDTVTRDVPELVRVLDPLLPPDEPESGTPG